MKPDQWLESYYDGEFFTGRFDHLKDVVENLSLIPERGESTIITIAGTNGKGETARVISSTLKSNNKTVALWTSPHLFCVNERFSINGLFACDDELLRTFKRLQHISEKNNFKLSYFEFLFIAFLMLVKEKKTEFIILEVGLGGRLDAVNILDAKYCLLTSISRDHQEILGSRYDEILKEKLGVLRDGCTFFSGLEHKYLHRKVQDFIENRAITWLDLFKEGHVSSQTDFSLRNTQLGLKLVNTILGSNIIPTELKENFACRYTFMLRDVSFDLYPSHNMDGVRKLVQFLQQSKYNKYEYVLVGFSERSIPDLRVMVRVLKSFFEDTQIIIYKFRHWKALNESGIKQIMDEFSLKVTDEAELYQFIKSRDSGKVLVTGSNYFIGEFVRSHEGTSFK